MPEEQKFVQAPENVCRVADTLVEKLKESAKKAIEDDNLELARNRIFMIDELLGFKRRCEGVKKTTF